MSVGAIEALAPARGGCYRDGVITVRPRSPVAPRRPGGLRTAHFDLLREDGELVLEHALTLAGVDDDLAGLLSEELFEPGWLRGADLFERVFTGVVLTCDDDPVTAWAAFYENTLRAVDRAAPGDADLPAPPEGGAGHGTVAGYAPVYRRVAALVRGRSVLELGSCFGFLALRLADRHEVIASDVSSGTMDLLQVMSGRMGLPLDTLVCDAAHVPRADRSVDTVLAVHLLEHLEPEHAGRVIGTACRLARQRVVVAVPLEERPSEQYGHLWAVTLDALQRWADGAAGWCGEVSEDHGGWLVLDRVERG
ncbi:mycofactocin oligosaccharide methyltransferase MftM [Janibacter alkaliphilus]|uniref:SAM-dependent methyltransferase n=1 Tax=Janibacter alkaliphilus TaxID=1069963 RepID=A0A852X802_9MICO|nr:SAM-dependent methyltransferase [Janibacter alkaliphilus]